MTGRGRNAIRCPNLGVAWKKREELRKFSATTARIGVDIQT